MKFYRGPLKWIDKPNEQKRWEGPFGANCLDTRTIEQQATAGGPEQAVLFVTEHDVADSAYELIADGTPEEIKLTGRMRQLLPAPRGYRPKGDTLSQAIADLFLDGADPDGVTGPKPLMPSRGRFELNAGRCFHEDIFRYGKHDKNNLVKTMVQRQIKDASDACDRGELKAEMLPKMLGYELRKYGLSKDDWTEFVPTKLRTRIDHAEDPATSVSDNFNRADGGLGASWGSAVGTWAIKSNQVQKTASGLWECVVFQTALSGSDHYAELKDLYPSPAIAPCAICRKANDTAKTFYAFGVYGGNHTLWKLVSGTQTNLTTTGGGGSAVHRTEIIGSALKGYNNPPSTATLSATDTAITGNLYVGMTQVTNYAVVTIDDFAGADIGGGGGGILYTQLERSTRGYLRGVYQGR